MGAISSRSAFVVGPILLLLSLLIPLRQGPSYSTQVDYQSPRNGRFKKNYQNAISNKTNSISSFKSRNILAAERKLGNPSHWLSTVIFWIEKSICPRVPPPTVAPLAPSLLFHSTHYIVYYFNTCLCFFPVHIFFTNPSQIKCHAKIT